MAELRTALNERFAERLSTEPGPRPCDLTLRLSRPGDLVDAARELVALGMSIATVVATDEQDSPDHDLKIRYVFEPAVDVAGQPLADQFVTLVVSLDPTAPEIPSLSVEIPAANWHEREVHDLFGITPLDHPDPRSLVLHDGWPSGLYPMRKSFDASQRVPRESAVEFPHMVVEGEGVLEIPVGPIHAGIIEPGHFRFSSVGETVLNLDARLFYTHRGLEKRMEGLTPLESSFIAERICGVCSVSHVLGYCAAAEQIAEVEVPACAQTLRAIALELERLYNHAGDVGNICAGMGYHYGTSAGLRIKEQLQMLNERVSGNRFLRGLVTLGGVSRNLNAELRRAAGDIVRKASEELEQLVQSIDRNPSVVDRLDGTGILTRQAAIDLGVTGVAARASGVARDARLDHPVAGCGGADPVVPKIALAEAGDVHARLRVRSLEATESARLIGLLLDRVESGPVQASLPPTMPAGRIGLSVVESPRGASVHWLRFDARGRVDRYHLRSASYANWPAVPLAAQTAIVPDFPLVNKSFELCYSCTDR